jgi:hypothetical protein
VVSATRAAVSVAGRVVAVAAPVADEYLDYLYAEGVGVTELHANDWALN